VTAEIFFSSFDLVTKLHYVKFNYVGTLKKNKTEIPDAFQPHKTKATNSSIFGFLDEKTLVSYVPKPNKAVILISSMHLIRWLKNIPVDERLIGGLLRCLCT